MLQVVPQLQYDLFLALDSNCNWLPEHRQASRSSVLIVPSSQNIPGPSLPSHESHHLLGSEVSLCSEPWKGCDTLEIITASSSILAVPSILNMPTQSSQGQSVRSGSSMIRQSPLQDTFLSEYWTGTNTNAPRIDFWILVPWLNSKRAHEIGFYT